MAQLTERQAEIKRLLLEEGLTAREAGARLDITRNAVYQVIAALKKKGELPPDFTPSGETRIPAGGHAAQMVRIATGDGPTSAQLDVVRELAAQNSRLLAIIEHLTGTGADSEAVQPKGKQKSAD